MKVGSYVTAVFTVLAALVINDALAFWHEPEQLTIVFRAGESWMSPPVYTTAAEGKSCTIEARAVPPRDVTAVPSWTTSDPSMVTITAGADGTTRLVAARSVQTRVRVTAGDRSRELTLDGACNRDVLQMAILDGR